MNGKDTENGSFNPSKIETLINLVYPVGEDFYENILTNKQKTFSDIKDVLEALRGESKLVIIVDDFDLIDETSFEFIKYLTNKDFFTQGAKIPFNIQKPACSEYVYKFGQTAKKCMLKHKPCSQ